MKNTGIVRDLDQLGRVVIPKELRTTFGIKEGDPIEILLNGSDIVLRKVENGCAFCSSNSDLVAFEGKSVCRKCLKKLKQK